MPTTQQCLDAMEAAVGRKLTDDEQEAVADALAARLRAKQAEVEVEGLDRVTMRAANELAEEAELAGVIERRNQMLTVLADARVRGFLDRFDNKAEGIEALLVGINKNFAGGQNSIAARQKAIESEFLGGMIHDLRRADPNAIAILTSGQFDREIARDLWALGKEGADGSGNLTAKKIAEVIGRYQETARKLQNDAGSAIRKMPGYIMAQNHDAAKLRRAGFDAWRAEILPRLDPARTFDDAGIPPDKVEGFLRSVFDDIVNNRHLTVDGAENDLLAGFKGPANLGKKVSRARKLHFKSADDFMDYNAVFGVGTLMEGVFRGLDRASMNAALMQTLGPNPRALFDRIRQDVADALPDARRVQGQRIDWHAGEVFGETRIPEHVTGASLGSAFRAWQSMARLGGATISAFADIPLMAHEVSRHTGSLLDGYRVAISNLLDGHGTGERREIADLLGVGLDGTVGGIAARFDTTDNMPGRMSKLMQRFFKFSGLAWWTDNHKRGVALMFSRHLAMERNKAWSAVGEDLKTTLGLFDIGEKEWALLKGRDLKRADGVEYVTPDFARDLSDAEVKAYLGDDAATDRKVRETRRDLEQRFRAYFTERTDFAVITPGARERAYLTLGARPGTPLGEAVRMFMQFKAFPVTVVSKVLIPSLRAAFGPERDVAGLAHMILATTAFGYMSMAVKDVLKNKEPRDPFDPKTIAAAFVQGGGAGIYGDFLFGQYNRYGGGGIETLAGPGVGVVGDIGRIWAQARDGKDAGAMAYRTILNNTPFLNLFYVRPAFDYLIGHTVQEAVSPGSLRRMERRMQKEEGRGFIVPPTP